MSKNKPTNPEADYLSVEQFEARGSERRMNRSNLPLKQRMKLNIARVAVFGAGVGVLLGGVKFAGDAFDETFRTVGSETSEYCVPKNNEIVYDRTYQARLDAISVYPGERVDAATVPIVAEGNHYRVIGELCPDKLSSPPNR